MYTVTHEAVLDAPLEHLWSVSTDVDRWPDWDPHEEAATLRGPFAVGTQGWSKPHGAPPATWTITAVEPGHLWSSQCQLPGGRLSGSTRFDPTDDGRVRCTRTVTVTGPLVPLFRLWFGPRIRRDMRRSLAALERRAQQVASAR